MRASRIHRALQFASVATSLPAALLLFANRAAAAPSAPADEPCANVTGPAKEICESSTDDGKGGGGSAPDPTSPLDPLQALADGCAKAASWTVDQLAELVNKTTEVDFTNPEFLRQYAVVFAASTILTLTLWLLAVAKRAIRGVPFVEAITEAIGFLWLTVIASAFTPLILYTVVSATDAVTDVLAAGTSAETDKFFGTFSEALKNGDDIGGGPIMLIVVSLISVLAAGILYLELVVRAALLYVGALLGTAVYAGLVDKNMWGHVRRWAGIMIAVILVKPVIVIVLGLAGALSSDDGPNAFSAIVSGLAIILLAIFASAMIYRFVPGFGDEIAQHRSATRSAARGGAAVVSSPAALVRQGINTHSSRGGQSSGGDGGGTPQPAGQVAGGVAAHSSRGSGGSSEPAPKAPRTYDRSAPPRSAGSGGGNRSGGDRR